MASGFFKFYFIKNTKYILITMKDIVTYITEANTNQIIFNACMELDNNEEIYRTQYHPLVQNLIKKHKSGKFDIETLEKSSVVSKLATRALKVNKENGLLSSDGRKRLYKFITGCLLCSIENYGETLTKEEEDYRLEWNYADSDKCGW